MASDINKVVVVGRLVSDSELNYSPAGIPILKFTIANNRSVKKNEQWKTEVSFFDCVFFGKQAEYHEKNLIKGCLTTLIGELRQDVWEKEGKKQSKISIVVDNVSVQNQDGNKPVTSDKPSTRASDNKQYSQSSFDEDIPF